MAVLDDRYEILHTVSRVFVLHLHSRTAGGVSSYSESLLLPICTHEGMWLVNDAVLATVPMKGHTSVPSAYLQ